MYFHFSSFSPKRQLLGKTQALQLVWKDSFLFPNAMLKIQHRWTVSKNGKKRNAK